MTNADLIADLTCTAGKMVAQDMLRILQRESSAATKALEALVPDAPHGDIFAKVLLVALVRVEAKSRAYRSSDVWQDSPMGEIDALMADLIDEERARLNADHAGARPAKAK